MAGAAAEDFNHRIIEEFRANGGRVGGPLAGTPLLLLHHIGAKSGIERVTPLAYRPHGDGRYVIVASNGGSPTHPGWYHNLKANPVVEVEVGTETFMVRAEELDSRRPPAAVVQAPRGVSIAPRVRSQDRATHPDVHAHPPPLRLRAHRAVQTGSTAAVYLRRARPRPVRSGPRPRTASRCRVPWADLADSDPDGIPSWSNGMRGVV